MICAVCAALCVVLSAVFSAVPGGAWLASLRLPVLLCALACGAGSGALCGAVGVLLSAAVAGVPTVVLLPAALAECVCCGAVAGLMMRVIHTDKPYAAAGMAAMAAMLCGCIASAVVQALLFAPEGAAFAVWTAGSMAAALPGAVIQLVVISGVVAALTNGGLLPQSEQCGEVRSGSDK